MKFYGLIIYHWTNNKDLLVFVCVCLWHFPLIPALSQTCSDLHGIPRTERLSSQPGACWASCAFRGSRVALRSLESVLPSHCFTDVCFSRVLRLHTVARPGVRPLVLSNLWWRWFARSRSLSLAVLIRWLTCPEFMNSWEMTKKNSTFPKTQVRKQ